VQVALDSVITSTSGEEIILTDPWGSPLPVMLYLSCDAENLQGCTGKIKPTRCPGESPCHAIIDGVFKIYQTVSCSQIWIMMMI